MDASRQLRILLLFALAAACCAAEVEAQPLTVIEKAAPSVVFIQAFTGDSVSTGSGFFVNADGDLVTCRHVLEGADSARILTRDGGMHRIVAVIAEHRGIDLVRVSTSARGAAVPAGMSAQAPAAGDSVVAIGNPLGMRGLASPAVIGRVRTLSYYGRIAEVRGALEHGSSGGPVFDRRGKVTGIIAWGDREKTTHYALAASMLDSLRGVDPVPLAQWSARARAQSRGGDSCAAVDIPVEVSSYFDRAKCLAGGGRTAEAIASLEHAVEYDASCAVCWEYLGGLLASRGAWRRAADCVYRAMALGPVSCEAEYALGVSLLELGRADSARRRFEALLVRCPDVGSAHFNLAKIHYEAGRYGEAARCFERVIALQDVPSCDAWFNLALAREAADELQQAASALREARKLCPDSANILLRLGSVAFRLRAFEAAADAFDAAARRHPDDARAWSGLGESRRALGQTRDAIDAFRRAVRLRPDSLDGLLALGSACFDAGNTVEALVCYRRAVQLRPGSYRSWMVLGLLLYRGERVDSALAVFQKISTMWPDSADAYRYVGQLHLGRKRYREASLALMRIVTLRRADCATWHNLGIARDGATDLKGALEAFENAARLCPDSADGHARLGEQYLKNGRLDDAVRSFERAARLTPRDATLLLALGQVYHLARRGDEARAIVPRLERLDPALAQRLQRIIDGGRSLER